VNFFHTIWRWHLSLGQRRAVKQEIDDELRFHIEQRTAENIATGMSPEEAAREARKRFGNLQGVREECREKRGASLGETTLQDIRFGLRVLRKNPGFTAVAVLTLALGIGANTIVFSLINAVLLRPLDGVEEPGRVAAIYTSDYSSGRYGTSSYPDYLDLSEERDVFAWLAAYRETVLNLTVGDETERLEGLFVTGSYFSLLGLKTVAGRPLLPDDDVTPGGHPVVVLSHGFWKRRFNSDPAVIGRTLSLDGRVFTVVGVVAEGFRGTKLSVTPALWIPMKMFPEDLTVRGNRGLWVVGRLRPGVRLEQAQARVSTVAARLAKAYPSSNLGTLGRPQEPRPMTVASESLLGPEERAYFLPISGLLMAATSFVLLIACANVANLLLARASRRRREIAIRLAVGASRSRLVRQLLTEGFLLSLLGAVLGLLLMVWASGLLPSLLPPIEPISGNLGLDGRMLGFVLGLSLVSTIIAGLAPALQATGFVLTQSLKDEQASPTGKLDRFRLRNVLMTAQVACSLVLLIGAGLFIRSLRNMATADLGFDPRNVLLAATATRFGTSAEQSRAFYQQLQERVGAFPGVRSASLTKNVPLSGGRSRMFVEIEGYQPRPNEDTELDVNTVGLDYFKTLGIPLLQGRDFDSRDTATSQGVAIVNQELARRFLSGQNPIGRRLRTGGQSLEIIGVARDSKYRNVRESPLPFIYFPLSQRNVSAMTLLVRADSNPLKLAPSIRAELQRLDKYVPLFNVTTFPAHLRMRASLDRTVVVLLSAFGGIALVLAAIGIYGVVAYSVGQRTREIGIRLALGAPRNHLLGLVLQQGLKLAAAGVVIGLGGAFALTRLLRSLLFEVSPTDPVTFVVIPLVLGAVTLVACWLPARRAAKVDPMVALRYE
jgi:predicted permease